MDIVYEKHLEFLCDICNRNMDIFNDIEDNFCFSNNSDPKIEGYGFKFYGKKDKFQPIFAVLYKSFSEELDISIIVMNRNGNSIIIGNTIGIYTLKFDYKDDMTDEEINAIDERYRKMVKYTINKWASYNKENIIGYIEEEERKEF